MISLSLLNGAAFSRPVPRTGPCHPQFDGSHEKRHQELNGLKFSTACRRGCLLIHQTNEKAIRDDVLEGRARAR